MEVRIFRINNDREQSVAVSLPELVNGHQPLLLDIFDIEDVQNFILGEASDDARSNLTERFVSFGDFPVPDELKDTFLTSVATNGAILKFETSDIEYDDDEDTVSAEVPAEGTVYVLTSGGLSCLNVTVTNGVTTVADVISSPVVASGSHSSASDLMHGVVFLNDREVVSDSLSRMTVRDGDHIVIHSSVAHTKGC